MPNWCSNNLTLEHTDSAMIDRVETAVSAGKLLSEFIPIPAAQADDWYDWNVANWGTKWDVGDEYAVVSRTANTIELCFDSAWAPSVVAYRLLREQGFTVEAFYYESGMSFCGKFDESGDNCYEYGGMSAEEVRAAIPEDLDDMYGISEFIEHWDEDNAS